MMNCKSCGKKVLIENMEYAEYHLECFKSKMDTTTFIDEKMDLRTYPVSYDAPAEKETKEEQWGHLYKALGVNKATVWMAENVYNDRDMEDIFHKIMEGEIDL